MRATYVAFLLVSGHGSVPGHVMVQVSPAVAARSFTRALASTGLHPEGVDLRAAVAEPNSRKSERARILVGQVGSGACGGEEWKERNGLRG